MSEHSPTYPASLAGTPEQTDAAERQFERLRVDLGELLTGIGGLDTTVSRADLAERLGTSRAHITQTLRGDTNPTLRTVAELCAALGVSVELRSRVEQPPEGRFPLLMVDNNSPRRNRMDHWSPGERAIQSAVDAVERMGADIALTDAVVLLGKAKDRVADYVDAQIRAGSPVPPSASSDEDTGTTPDLTPLANAMGLTLIPASSGIRPASLSYVTSSELIERAAASIARAPESSPAVDAGTTDGPSSDEVRGILAGYELHPQSAEGAAQEREAIMKLIGAEWCEVGQTYWLSADPGPVECDSLAECVKEALRLAEKDGRREGAAREYERLTATRSPAVDDETVKLLEDAAADWEDRAKILADCNPATRPDTPEDARRFASKLTALAHSLRRAPETRDANAIDDLIESYERACRACDAVEPSRQATKERAILRNEIRARLLATTPPASETRPEDRR